MLGFAPQFLFPLIEDSSKFYRSAKIRKVDGSFRTLMVPTPSLRGVQRAILQKLAALYDPPDCVYAYIKGRSSVSAARRLCGNKCVLKIDIEDFFGTITERRAYGLFISLGFDKAMSYMLARLCTVNGRLAQGAPTSPMISNIIMLRFDAQMIKLAKSWGLEYTRYSDDMYLTCFRYFDHKKMSLIVNNMILQHGFRENSAKRRFFPRGRTRFTLGLNTSKSSPILGRKKRREFRAAFHRAEKNPRWAVDNINLLTGMLSWYQSIYGRSDTWRQYRSIIRVAKSLRLHETYQV